MTLKEKIGQLVFAGFSGQSFDDNIKNLIKEYKLGNVVLFSRNIGGLEQLHNLNQTIYHVMLSEFDIIPFIAIDQEGGMVTRIMNEATFLPGNMTVAASGNPNNAYELGKISGTELRALGINMNLAPSLDVNNNPKNPVIGVRSYGDDPKRVSEFGLKNIEGLQSQGIIATAKHFPGHGDTATDSHYRLPIVPHDKKRLDEIELYPFKEAIKKGVGAIMSAHVFFTAYEQDNLPATLSSKVMTDLLRKELHFEGLIVSDCMEMKAIDDNYTAARGALMGLLAGLDMVMVSATYQKQKDTLELIAKAVSEGTFPLELLDEKVSRVLKAKAKILPLMEEYFFKPSFLEKKAVITDPLSKAFSSKIVDLSLTKVRGCDFYPEGKTLLVATEPFATTIAEDVLSTRSIIDAAKAERLTIDTIKIPVNPDEEQVNSIVSKAWDYQTIVVCTYNAGFNQNQAKLVNLLNKKTRNLFVISTRNPYDLLAFKNIANYYCVYEYTPNSVKTIARFLKGDIIPTGKLPVSLQEKIRIGASVYVGLEQTVSENLAYLDLLKAKKIELVFISGHIPEMRAGFKEELKTIVDHANELGLKVILDVSRPMMENFEIPKIYSLRLDFGFSLDEVYKMSMENSFNLELNASTVTENDLNYLEMLGMDMNRLRVSHNFYPKPYTGLAQADVETKNVMFKKHGLTVMVYIPSQNQKRGPIHQGLPTVEEHRNLPLPAILSEMRCLLTDEVVFGDSFASAEELTQAVDFNFDLIQLPIKLKTQITDLEKQQLCLLHRNRQDGSPYFKRSSTRLKAGEIEPNNAILRMPKDVTIDNKMFARYQGEVSIVTMTMPEDERVNVVGEVIASDYLIKKITSGTRFKFLMK